MKVSERNTMNGMKILLTSPIPGGVEVIRFAQSGEQYWVYVEREGHMSAGSAHKFPSYSQAAKMFERFRKGMGGGAMQEGEGR
tara:strand:+ start:2108 stop:2356 length:249 start_codon:yes stop_codon:yes gene_type:complete